MQSVRSEPSSPSIFTDFYFFTAYNANSEKSYCFEMLDVILKVPGFHYLDQPIFLSTPDFFGLDQFIFYSYFSMKYTLTEKRKIIPPTYRSLNFVGM